MNTSACRYCGKPIVWGMTPGGPGEAKRIPLDPTPPVYIVEEEGDGSAHSGQDSGTLMVFLRGRFPDKTPRAMVSHFATCPGASKASADAKARREEVTPDSRDTQA